MAVTLSLRAFDPYAPSRELATDEESPRLAPVTALYRFFDADKRLLYIGITGQPRERWPVHRRKAVWWPRAAFVAVEIHDTEWQALDAERAAIKAENPQFNKRSKKGVR